MKVTIAKTSINYLNKGNEFALSLGEQYEVKHIKKIGNWIYTIYTYGKETREIEQDDIEMIIP